MAADQFVGWCSDGALNRVFGGQVAAQAVAAAGDGLGAGWRPTSLHAYFVREGRSASPIEYRVDRLADDAAVRTCHVVAAQHDKPILMLDVSFVAPDGGPLPPLAAPDPGTDLGGWTPADADGHAWVTRQAQRLPFELRFARAPSRVAGQRGEVVDGQQFWFRTRRPLPDEALQHACALTYVSDLFLVSTVLARHGLPGGRSDLQAASIDHAVWFHRPARADAWVRYEQRSPTSAGGRGLAEGRMLDRAGELLVTVRQEVLLRVPEQSPVDG